MVLGKVLVGALWISVFLTSPTELATLKNIGLLLTVQFLFPIKDDKND